jgi:imidazolonepropionase
MMAVVECGQLVSLAGPRRPRTGAEMRELGIVKGGALLVRDGRIEQVGKIEIPRGCEVVDARGRVVMPGFVDAHTHPVFAGARVEEYEMRSAGATYREIALSGGGIRSTVRLTRAATEDELVAAGKRYAKWFLRGGTTAVEAKSGYGLSIEDELKILRAIRRLSRETPLDYIPTFLGAHETPDEFQADREGYLRLVVEEMLPRVVAAGLAEYCDVFCEPGVFSLEQTRRVLAAAKARGLQLRLHADQLSLSGGAVLAAEMGAVTADHLENTDERGIAAMRQAGVQPVLLPGSVYALGLTRYPAARAMLDAGLAVVLATDFNPGSSPTTSMPMVLSLASTQMKMTPAEAITAATINAAYSVGRGRELGSLETGKRADFVLYDVEDYRDIAYFFGIDHVAKVYSRGCAVWQGTEKEENA